MKSGVDFDEKCQKKVKKWEKVANSERFWSRCWILCWIEEGRLFL